MTSSEKMNYVGGFRDHKGMGPNLEAFAMDFHQLVAFAAKSKAQAQEG